jgi:DNA-directed RNA polymerase III subunit RPC4
VQTLAMEEKLQQPRGGPAAEEYTHGGVKKTKFEPKVPTRRLKKVSVASVKSEPGEVRGGRDEQALPKELQRLLQQVESDGRRDRPNQRTSKVAFGFTGTDSSRSSTSGLGLGKPGAGGRVFTRVLEKQEFLQADEVKEEERKRFEVFDYEKYYPVTLPLRKPGDEGGVEEEFGEGDGVEEEDESGVEAAEELGLREIRDEDRLLFFQFPKGLPMSWSAGGKERSARLEELGKGGAMGKIQVYESGAVKFKIGDVVLDALPGTECMFAQEVAAVNVAAKRCAFVGEVHKRVVLVPDVTEVLQDLTDLRSKP